MLEKQTNETDFWCNNAFLNQYWRFSGIDHRQPKRFGLFGKQRGRARSGGNDWVRYRWIGSSKAPIEALNWRHYESGVVECILE